MISEEKKNTEKNTIVISSGITSRSPRLTIRSDEAAKRRIADTDGMMRRKRQIAENNRLI